MRISFDNSEAIENYLSMILEFYRNNNKEVIKMNLRHGFELKSFLLAKCWVSNKSDHFLSFDSGKF